MATQPKPTQTKPPQSEWPKYILDLGATPADRWTVREFAKVESQFWDPKVGWKYGAISYAWGNWHDKTDAVVGTQQNGYPAFDIGTDPATNKPINWTFPVLNRMDTSRNFYKPVDPIFLISDVQSALKALGLRWVWWDWACIPQGNDSSPAAKLSPDLEAVQGQEVNKMRFIYPRSLKGCLWLHQATWVKDRLLVKSPLESLLDQIVKIRQAGKSASLPIESVRSFLDGLDCVKDSQASLNSVWSFQEGVLFSDYRRPHRDDVAELGNFNAESAVILDHNGDALVNDAFNGKKAGLMEIVTLASSYASTITDVLQKVAQGVAVNTAGQPAWVAWLIDPNNEAAARALLSRLIATGLVGYTYNNPLPLLEAKFARAAPWMSEADLCVNAVTGAMDIELGTAVQESIVARDAAKASAKAQNLDWAATNKLVSAEECKPLKPVFLRSMFETYQWRMLLLARSFPAPPAPVAGAAPPAPAPVVAPTSWWPSFVQLDRPKFASLEYYIGSDNLTAMYQPRLLAPPALPADLYDLPKLNISANDALTLIIQPKSTYKAFDLTKPTAQGWTKSEVYTYIDGPTVKMPGTVGFVNVDFKNREAALGKNIVLLPIEDSAEKLLAIVGLQVVTQGTLASKPVAKSANVVSTTPAAPPPPPKYIRCAILFDYNPVASTAVFRGIGDFQGLKTADQTLVVDKAITVY